MNDLSEREKKFLQMVCDQTGGDVSELVDGDDLYPLAKKMGFNENEVLSISKLLKGLRFLEMKMQFGKIQGQRTSVVSCVRLTSLGVLYARSLK
jgi:hypothetical protein